jgi:hypothetical protein
LEVVARQIDPSLTPWLPPFSHSFLVGVFTRFNETPVEQRNYLQKDGALLAIGSLADKLKTTAPYKDALEDMLVRP